MSENRPNILWICTDSQRWDTLGCYGNEFVTTPNIDRLAREGVLFENAYCQNPLCTPSRGSFLTGRYPVTTRLRQNGQTVPPDLKPISKTLSDSGFICGLSGKLHLSNVDQRLTFGPDWWKVDQKYWRVPFEKRVDDGYSVFHWSHGNSIFPHSAYTQWLKQHGWLEQEPDLEANKLGPLVSYGRPGDQTHTAFCIDKAIEFIEVHQETDCPHPWMFSINGVDPHPDFHPPEAFMKPYLEKLDDIPLPHYEEGELDDKPSHQKEFYETNGKQATRTWTDRERRLARAAYWASCDHIDYHVGKLLDALDRTGQRENTMIIFTSDHGELLGDHGRTWKGPYLYEGAVHVPLIISWPGKIEQGIRSDALVELTDLAPTILDACEMPADPSMQGRSLWELLTGKAEAGYFRDDVYCEYYNSNPNNPPKWLTMIREKRYKMIAVHNTLEGELYDLEADPWEHKNLWDDPQHKDVKIMMLQRMAARMAFTADPMPERVGVF